ncbi:MAG TPA: helix-turn-helix domain-containing protein [Ilumatobacter sp.]|nr:helix-turn-helix domain-containing protein [Ilumatobacter sp.]
MADQRIVDPLRIRALAHPLRIALLDVLGDEPGEFTATECAQRTGESVASCAYHLHTLAKYGFVEAGAKRGRDKPWRLTNPRGIDVRPDFADPVALRAVTELAAFQIEHQLNRLREWIGAVPGDDPAWTNSSTITSSRAWMTQAELAAVSATLQRIAEHVAGRSDDPSKRPPGARPVQIFGFAGVDFDRDDR